MKKQKIKHLIPALIAAVAVILTVNISAKPGKTNVKTSIKANTNTRTVGGIEFVKIPAGCFIMGSKSDTRYERPPHKRCLKSFWIAKYETTQQQYMDIMGKNPSISGECITGDCPVNNVGWDDAQEFIKKFNDKHKSKIRLPSEAEWEYAARAGTSTRFYWGNQISKKQSESDYHFKGKDFKWKENDPVGADYEWSDNNSGDSPHPVGRLKPNKWGLYDVNGNVEEWVQDCWNENYIGAPGDGSAWMTGDCVDNRIVRGGSFVTFLGNTPLTGRSPDGAGGMKDRFKGFRLVLPE